MTQTYILKPVILQPYTEIQQNSQSFRQDEFKSKSAERTIVREYRLNSKNSPVSSFVNDAVPLKESWLFNNKKALTQLNNGIKDSAKGQVKFIETDIVIARSEATRQSRKIIKNSVNGSVEI